MDKLKRIADFERLGIGLFVHWGLYSQIGKGEWYKYQYHVDSPEYMKLIETFNADGFKPRELAKFAKENGINYITLTTRHHESFSLYDTRGLSEFDVMHSPVGRDLVKEFVDACNEFDVIPFFYHATAEWNVDSFEDDFDAYLEYLRKSVEVLCTNYGKIGGFWFDGNWAKPDADWKVDQLYATIRKYQPEAIIINNTGLFALGAISHPEVDSVTFEQGIPCAPDRSGLKKYVAGEMCQPMNNHWGIAEYDVNYKSSRTLIENLCACRKVGANYLINVGPQANGEIPLMQKALLQTIGQWLRVNGEAIYTTEPSTIRSVTQDFVLDQKDEHGDILRSYLFVHHLEVCGDPNVSMAAGAFKTVCLTNVEKKVKSVTWIDNEEEIEYLQGTKTKSLIVNATNFKYGADLVVRVAKILYE